jgi:hypothetical protein
MVCNGLVSHSSLNHTHCSFTVILTGPWHRRSCENYLLLLTAQLMTASDLSAKFEHRKLDHGMENLRSGIFP